MGAPVLSDNLFIKSLVSCPSLDDPSNGNVDCSLGDDGVPSYEDTCTFTCDTGYELTGSDTWTCQNDGRWSGSAAMCRRSESSYTYVESEICMKHILC